MLQIRRVIKLLYADCGFGNYLNVYQLQRIYVELTCKEGNYTEGSGSGSDVGNGAEQS